MTDDLVKRLRDWAALVNENATASVFVSDEFRTEHRERAALLTEAADRIEALERDNAALTKRLADNVSDANLSLLERATAAELALTTAPRDAGERLTDGERKAIDDAKWEQSQQGDTQNMRLVARLLSIIARLTQKEPT